MQINKIENNTFKAKLYILGDKRILTKKDIADFKTVTHKFAKGKDSITVNIGKLNTRESSRKTTVDILVNGIKFKEECNELFDTDIRKFLIKFFKELNKPVK